MSNYGYLLRQIDHRLLIAVILLPMIWAGGCLYNTTEEQLALFQAQYPLTRQWHLAQHCEAKAWHKLIQGSAWARGRLKVVLQFLLDQFSLTIDQIKIEEANSAGSLQTYSINIVVSSLTDAEILEFLQYVERELFPLVHIEKFSLHRSRTLDESMLQNGQDIHLIEGRIKLVWISK